MNRTPEASNYVDFFVKGMGLKDIPRTGYVIRGVPNPESVADHTYGTTVMVDPIIDAVEQQLNVTLNRYRVTRMMEIHDLGEVDTGDVVVQKGAIVDIKAQKRKEAEERRSIMRTASIIRKTAEYLSLFMEFRNGKTLEARVAKAIDKMETVVQAYRYEVAAKKVLQNFDDFYIGNDEVFQVAPIFHSIHQEILRRREKIKTRNALINADPAAS